MSINNIVTGRVPEFTTYDSNGNVTGVTTTNVTASANVSATIVNATYLIGDGSNLTNVPASSVVNAYGNANVSNYLASGTDTANITTTGNITGALISGTNSIVSGSANATTVNAVTVNGTTVNTNVVSAVTSVTAPEVNATNVTVSANITNNNLTLAGNSISSVDTVMYLDPAGDGSSTNGNVVILGNLSVGGNLTYTDVSTATTGNLLWIAASSAGTPVAANGGGLAVGPNVAPYATWLYNSTNSSWDSNIGISAAGDITTTGNVSAALDVDATGNIVVGGNATVTGNIEGSYILGNGRYLTGMPEIYGNSNVSVYLASGTDPFNIVTTGNVQGQYIVGDGSQLVNINANIIQNGNSNVSIASAGSGVAFNVNGNASGVVNQNQTALGYLAGGISQGTNSVAVGTNAGYISQGGSAVAVGAGAGSSNQTGGAVAVGYQAGYTNQAGAGVAIGNTAGQTSQGVNSIAIGSQAGQSSQATGAIAIGAQAGNTSQSAGTVAIGVQAGQNSLTANSVVIGSGAGITAGGADVVAVGWNAGANSAGQSVSMGSFAGQSGQGEATVAVGYQAGSTNQGVNSVAVGPQAGSNAQSTNSVAIGHVAGSSSQGVSSVAIGSGAGGTSQGSFSVAIGDSAGLNNQGANSIAIGYGAGSSNLQPNTTVLNTKGVAWNPATNGFFVSGLRSTQNLASSIASANGVRGLYYDIYGSTTQEITSYNVNMWAGVFAPFNGGTFSQVMLGGVIQLAGNSTLPTGIMPCTKYNIYVQTGTTDAPTTLSAPGGGGFMYIGSTAYASINLYVGETLEVTSRGAGSNEWDITGGTAALRYQGVGVNNGVTSVYKSSVRNSTQSQNICYLDNFAVRVDNTNSGRVNIRMTDGSTVLWGAQGYVVGASSGGATGATNVWAAGTSVGSGFTELVNTGGYIMSYSATPYSYVVTAGQYSGGNNNIYRISIIGNYYNNIISVERIT